MATTQEKEQLASLAGFSVAFFNSNAELKKYFNQALKENWEPDRLLQVLRNTKWFKTHQDTARELLLLQKSDPATYKARLREMQSRIQSMVVQIGHPISSAALKTLTSLALNGGWNDDQIRRYLGNWNYVYKTVVKGGALGGQIAEVQSRLNQALRDYGVRLSTNEIGRALQGIAQGTHTEQGAMERIKRVAMSAFPGLADEIRGGVTVRDFAEPYIQGMAELWEMPSEGVDLFDPAIRSALSVKGKDGKFSPMTISDFETRLRKDPRWNKTDNAQDAMMQNGHQVLNAFGVTW